MTGPPPTVVPRRLHLFGDARFREWADSGLLAGWELYVWTDRVLGTDLGPLHNADLYDRADEIAPGHGAELRTDLARYEVLYRYGGVYVGDVEPFGPDPLLAEQHRAFCGWEIQDRLVDNDLVAAAPKHLWMSRLISGAAEYVPEHHTAGAEYLTARLTADVHVYSA